MGSALVANLSRARFRSQSLLSGFSARRQAEPCKIPISVLVDWVASPSQVSEGSPSPVSGEESPSGVEPLPSDPVFSRLEESRSRLVWRSSDRPDLVGIRHGANQQWYDLETRIPWGTLVGSRVGLKGIDVPATAWCSWFDGGQKPDLCPPTARAL